MLQKISPDISSYHYVVLYLVTFETVLSKALMRLATDRSGISLDLNAI